MKQKRLGKRIAAWLMCLAMVLTMINLPAFTTEVKAEEAPKCGENAYYAYDKTSKTLRIYGSGSLYNSAFNVNYGAADILNNDVQRALIARDMKKVIIGKDITSIGTRAFYGYGYVDGATNSQLETVELEEGSKITVIDGQAFSYCKSLSSFSMPDSVKTLGGDAFSCCESLASVTLSNNLETIGNEAFAFCKKLENVVIPPSVTTIEDSAFAHCDNLLSISIANPLVKIGVGSLDGDYNLENVHVSCSFDADTVGDGEEKENASSYWSMRTVYGTSIVKKDIHDFSEQSYEADEDGIHHNQKCKNCEYVNQENHDFMAQDGTCKTDVEACSSCGVKNIAYSGLDSKVSVAGLEYNRNLQSPEVTIDGVDESMYKVEDVSKVDAGTYEVKVTGKESYAGERTVTWTIGKTPTSASDVVCSFDSEQWQQYNENGSYPVVGVDAKDGVVGLGDISLSYFDESAGTSTTIPKDAGYYDVYVDIAEGDNYWAGRIYIGRFKIYPAPSDITIPETSFSKRYGDAAFNLGATKTGDGTLTYASSDEAVATVDSTGKVTITGEGTATITVSMAATRNYNEAESKTVTLNVEKGTLVEGTDYIIPTDLTAECGASLSSVDLGDAMFTWKDGTTELTAGDLEAGATISCTAIVKKAHYEDKEVEVNVAVTHSLSATHIEGTETHASQCSACKKNFDATACSGGAATCTKKAKCSVCGAEYGSFGAHKLKAVAVVPATCKTTGTKAHYVCETDGCDKLFADAEGNTEITDATTLVIEKDLANHTGETEIKNAKEATCKEPGYSGDTYCKDCGAKLESGSETNQLTTHKYDEGTVTKEASCTEDGVLTKKCSVCGVETTEVIKAKGHTEVVDKAVAPTCTETGLTEGKHCSDCKVVLTKQETVKATGHKWDNGTVTKQPTVTSEGVKTFKCTNTGCNETKTESIAKLPEPKKNEVIEDKTGNDYKVTDPAKKEVTYKAPAERSAKTITIPASVQINGVTYKVTKIDDKAFKGNTTVTKVVIPSSVTVIGAESFSGCKNLTTVSVPKNVTTIGKNAFKGCAKLTKVTLPSKCTKIGVGAFDGCKKMKTITIKSTKLTSKSVSAKAFKGLSKNVTIKVPKKQLKAYKSLLKKKGFKGKVK